MYYDVIYKHYERCLEKYGDNNLGVDWPNKEDVNKRNAIIGKPSEHDYHALHPKYLLK